MRILSKFFLFSFFYFILLIFSTRSSLAQNDCIYNDIAGLPGEQVLTLGCLENYIQSIIKVLFVIAPVVCLFFLLWGGIKFITSSGDPKNVEVAKKTMTYAILGLVIIFSAYLILSAIKTMTGVDLIGAFKIVYP
ncbi:hypothetical protein HY439_02900 [Candidatus Microgenomates bacterium]|nr:hypothetical protein [Candidatus Microgenomates bacterium]